MLHLFICPKGVNACFHTTAKYHCTLNYWFWGIYKERKSCFPLVNRVHYDYKFILFFAALYLILGPLCSFLFGFCEMCKKVTVKLFSLSDGIMTLDSNFICETYFADWETSFEPHHFYMLQVWLVFPKASCVLIGDYVFFFFVNKNQVSFGKFSKQKMHNLLVWVWQPYLYTILDTITMRKFVSYFLSLPKKPLNEALFIARRAISSWNFFLLWKLDLNPWKMHFSSCTCLC